MFNDININTILRFIQQEMTVEDMRELDISYQTLYKVKKYETYIWRMRFENIIKINDYIKSKKLERKRVEYVGIDIGTSRTLTASDKDMKRTLILENNRIANAIKTYEMCLKGKKPTKEKKENAKEALLRTIEANVDKLVNQLINHYIEPVTFVIGKVNPISTEMISHSVLYQTVLERLNNLSLNHDINIMTVDENFTSITCPKCNHKDGRNRTKSNKFDCKNCEFTHDNDDVIASVNIVKRYLEEGYTFE